MRKTEKAQPRVSLAPQEHSSSLGLYANVRRDVDLAEQQLKRLFSVSTEIHGTLLVAHGALMRAASAVKKMIDIEEG